MSGVVEQLGTRQSTGRGRKSTETGQREETQAGSENPLVLNPLVLPFELTQLTSKREVVVKPKSRPFLVRCVILRNQDDSCVYGYNHTLLLAEQPSTLLQKLAPLQFILD